MSHTQEKFEKCLDHGRLVFFLSGHVRIMCVINAIKTKLGSIDDYGDAALQSLCESLLNFDKSQIHLN